MSGTPSGILGGSKGGNSAFSICQVAAIGIFGASSSQKPWLLAWREANNDPAEITVKERAAVSAL
jgi:hypothetical protein